MKGKYKAHSDLLQLLNQRKAWEGPEHYRAPEQDAASVGYATRLYGTANDSDPFAMGRMYLHLTRGFALVSEIIAESHASIKRRSQEAKPKLEVLEPIKRKLDADRAWNQHNSAMFKEDAA